MAAIVHLMLAAALALTIASGMPAKGGSVHAGHAVTALDCTQDGTCNGVYSSGGPPG